MLTKINYNYVVIKISLKLCEADDVNMLQFIEEAEL